MICSIFYAVLMSCVIVIYLVYRVSEWDNEVIKDYQARVKEFVSRITDDRFSHMQASEMRMPKVHMLFHYPMFVQYYGVPSNFEAGQAERAHIIYAGGVYRKTNRKDNYTQQMMTMNYRRKCLELLEDAFHE